MILVGVASLGFQSVSAHAQDAHVAKERVVVLRASGEAGAADLAEQIEDYLAEAIKRSGKLAVYEQVPAQQAAPPHPDTEAEARTIAEIHGAQYLVAAQVRALDEDKVAVELRVENVAHERYDTARFETFRARLEDAVLAVVPLALQAEGLGEPGVSLTKAISAGQGEWSPEGRAKTVESAEDPVSDPQVDAPISEGSEPSPSVEQSSDGTHLSTMGPHALGAGLGVRPLLRSEGSGGVLLGPVVQGRYRLVDGLSVHANLGLMWGAASALEATAGAAYLPLVIEDVQMRIGASLEAGAYIAFSGSRDPAFVVRASPVLFWALSPSIGLDVGVLEFGWVSGVDALALGGHARVRYSF